MIDKNSYDRRELNPGPLGVKKKTLAMLLKRAKICIFLGQKVLSWPLDLKMIRNMV